MMIKRYFKLKGIADAMVRVGTHDLHPAVRSIARQLTKLYSRMTREDRRIVDFKEEAELQMGC